ncbi:radical SAM protein [bacterium]|nr:radical SAM protein [candidate division CSSED10-310 bacterium]
MKFDSILRKASNGGALKREELILLLSFPADSREAYLTMATSRHISTELSGNQAEIHAQFALNLGICSGNCAFCSFAAVNSVFDHAAEISVEEAVARAKRFELDGANAVFVMSTAEYPFSRFVEYIQEIRRALEPRTILIGNLGDCTPAEARRLKDAGLQGVYHAWRLREGTDTTLKPAERRRSILNFQEAGLLVGTCVEPVGPEHSDEELADMILYTASIRPAYSGAARRIAIPGGLLAERGMISELRMAQIVAVTRLGMPRTVLGNCTHEPCTLGALAGANLFWAEVGANPRDVRERTEEGRGNTVADCGKLFEEAGCGILEGPSIFYRQV